MEQQQHKRLYIKQENPWDMDATVEVLGTLSSTMFYNDVLVNLTPRKSTASSMCAYA